MDPEFKQHLGWVADVLQFNENVINRMDPDARVPFFDTSTRPWIATLEQAHADIRSELDRLLERRSAIPPFQHVSEQQSLLTTDERWRTYFLQVYGWEIAESRKHCPRTWEALREIPGLSLAMFSILEPGKRLRPHTGPHKGVLRCHLGLKVPSTDPQRCGIRVHDQTRSWTEGKCLLFDDTLEHEAWNETDAERVVLFLDVLRPLPALPALLNRMIYGAARFSPAVKEIRVKAQHYAKQL